MHTTHFYPIAIVTDQGAEHYAQRCIKKMKTILYIFHLLIFLIKQFKQLMKKFILATLILLTCLFPSQASFENAIVSVQEIKVPKKVQNAYAAQIDALTSWLFSQYGALVIASSETANRISGGNYFISFDLFDMVDIIPHQVLNMVIKPNGEIVTGCVVEIPLP